MATLDTFSHLIILYDIYINTRYTSHSGGIMFAKILVWLGLKKVEVEKKLDEVKTEVKETVEKVEAKVEAVQAEAVKVVEKVEAEVKEVKEKVARKPRAPRPAPAPAPKTKGRKPKSKA